MSSRMGGPSGPVAVSVVVSWLVAALAVSATRSVAQDAAEDDPFPPLVENRISTLDKQFGPGFFTYFCDDGVMPRPYLVAYELQKNEDPETIEAELAEILTRLRAEFYRRFQAALGLEEIRRPVIVLVFEDLDSYAEVWAKRPDLRANLGLLPPLPGLGGYYDPGNGRLYLWGNKDDSVMWNVMFHEGTHQLVDQASSFRTQDAYFKRTPWFQEGIADYMGGHTRELVPDPANPGAFDTVFTLGQFIEERFQHARRARLQGRAMSLKELTHLDGRAFAELRARMDAESHEQLLLVYSQGWALSLFLNEFDGGRHREAFEALLRAEAKLDGGGATFARVMGIADDAGWDALNAEFWEWFEGDLAARSVYAGGGAESAGGLPTVSLGRAGPETQLGRALLLASGGDVVAGASIADAADPDAGISRDLRALADHEREVLEAYRADGKRNLRFAGDPVVSGKVAEVRERELVVKTRGGDVVVPRARFDLSMLESSARNVKKTRADLAEAFDLLGAIGRGDALAGSARAEEWRACLESARARVLLEELGSSGLAPADALARLERLFLEHADAPVVRGHEEEVLRLAEAWLARAYDATELRAAVEGDGRGTFRDDGTVAFVYDFTDAAEMDDFRADATLPGVVGQQLMPATGVAGKATVQGGRLLLDGDVALRFRHRFADPVEVTATFTIPSPVVSDPRSVVAAMIGVADPSQNRSFAASIWMREVVYTSQAGPRVAGATVVPELVVDEPLELTIAHEKGRLQTRVLGQPQHDLFDAVIAPGEVVFAHRGRTRIAIDKVTIAGRLDPSASAEAREAWVETRLSGWRRALAGGD